MERPTKPKKKPASCTCNKNELTCLMHSVNARLREALEASENNLRVMGDRAMLWQDRNAALVEKAALADEIAPAIRGGHQWEDWLTRYDALDALKEEKLI